MDGSPVWHPYTQHGLNQPVIRVERGEGAWLYTQDGRAILDAISSWWVTLHGHAHPAIAQAVARQAARLEQVIFAGFTHAPAEQLAERLVEIAPPGLSRVFYSDNGSTAVEVALKMAVGHWANRGETRTLFVALEHAYHGDTFGAMSVGAASPFTAFYQPLLFDVRRLPFPGGRGEEQTLAAFEAILKQEGGRVAALIVEPLVLGSGGMLTWGADILAKLAEMCRRYGVLWIADEVMTGFGRTGTLFAVEQSMALGGPPPDLMCLSKGITGGFMALGATLASEEIFQSFASPDRRRMLFHGHSYTGNPLACSAALASLELFARENTLDRVASIAAIHRKELARLAGHPKVSGVRQAGSIGVVEIMAADGGYLNDMAPKLAEFYLSRNVLLRPLGNVVYLLPPYCITPDELTLAYGVLHESLESVL